MFMITVTSMVFTFIILILISVLNIITKKTYLDREKISPFECGFDPKNLARLPFSLHFFLIAIIFIIFDVELTLFLPMIIIMKSTNMMTLSLVIFLYILILLFGLFHEQSQGSLTWTF